MEKPGVQRFREGYARVYGTIGFALVLVLGVAMIAVGSTLPRVNLRSDGVQVRFCGWMVSPRTSISTNCVMRRLRVSGRLAVPIRYRMA